MKVGDMVTFKHNPDAVGVITKVSPNIHKSVTYEVWVSWNFLNGQVSQNYSWQLDVINEDR